MNVVVYLGSRYGKLEDYRYSVSKFGEYLANNKHTLVYGGSKCGLMEDLAKSALENHGHVIGVMPQFFVDQNRHYENLSEFQIVSTMQERIACMIEKGDVFVAFPGGIGTLEEVFATSSAIALNHKDAMMYLVNQNQYYQNLQKQIEHMKQQGFIDQDFDKIVFVDDVNELIMLLEQNKSC